MLTIQMVKELIEKKDTKFATVTFIKADGSTRVVNGLFKPTSKMVGSDRGMAQGEAMKARGQVPVWEISSKSWKSFYADKVVSIN
jgi:hypothetical protein